jgi:prepilin-type N-terminal cleavage/methylation domain-containing protein
LLGRARPWEIFLVAYQQRGRSSGFTIVEILIAAAIVGILAAIAFPLYVNFQVQARVSRAQADVQTLVSAIGIFQGHMDGALPATLNDLTVPSTNVRGQVAGPMLGQVPTAPAGWTPYTYTPNVATGQFTVQATGDNTVVTRP